MTNHVNEYTPLIGSYHISINLDGTTHENAEGAYLSWGKALAGFVPRC